jgi:hypothetical protein
MTLECPACTVRGPSQSHHTDTVRFCLYGQMFIASP